MFKCVKSGCKSGFPEKDNMRKNDENKNNKPNTSVQSQKTKKFV